MQNPISSVLKLAALFTFFIGIVTLIAPGEIVRIFDGYDAPNNHFVRFIGTALIGFAVADWMYSQMVDVQNALPAIFGNLTSLVLAMGIDLVGIFTGKLTNYAWLLFVMHTAFALAFLYCVMQLRRMHN